MKMGPRLELRQSQQLVMTPQLQQAIKLLQMSNLDLAAVIEAEIERDPLLDRAPDPAPDDPRAAGERPDSAAETRLAAAETAPALDRVQADGAPETLSQGLQAVQASTPIAVRPTSVIFLNNPYWFRKLSDRSRTASNPMA